jgi:hypothetical protein
MLAWDCVDCWRIDGVLGWWGSGAVSGIWMNVPEERACRPSTG